MKGDSDTNKRTAPGTSTKVGGAGMSINRMCDDCRRPKLTLGGRVDRRRNQFRCAAYCVSRDALKAAPAVPKAT